MADQLELNMDGAAYPQHPNGLGTGRPRRRRRGPQGSRNGHRSPRLHHQDALGLPCPLAKRPPVAYMVSVGDMEFCSCADFEARQRFCKHVVAVEYTIRREERTDGSTVETETFRVAVQSQNWPAYNGAQQHEQEWFGKLLRDLCNGIEEPPQRMGRPRIPLGDMVLGIGLKGYSMLSTRRAMTAVRNAGKDGLLDKAPSCTSMFRLPGESGPYARSSRA